MVTIEEIKSVPDWANKSASDIRAYYDTPSNDRKPTSQATMTTVGLINLIGNDAIVEQMIAIIRAAGNVEAANALAAVGLDFGNPIVQSRLDALASDEQASQVFTPERVALLKSVGVDSRTPWQRLHGDDPLPAEEDFAAAIERAHTKDWLDARYQYVADQLQSGTISSKADALAEMGDQ